MSILLLLGTLAIMALFLHADFSIKDAFVGMLLCAGTALADTGIASAIVKLITGRFMALPMFTLVYTILPFSVFVVFRMAQYLGDKSRKEEEYLWCTRGNS